MEPETEYVVDVEPERIDYTEPESIDRWYSASQVQRLLDLNKAALQKAIAKLTSIYSLDIKILRRGGARATEYSQIAVDAIKLLSAQKFAELRKLVAKVSEPLTSAIVFVEQHNQIATTATSAADANLASISSLRTTLLNNWREAGRAWGRQAAAELQLGFTEEVVAGVDKLRKA